MGTVVNAGSGRGVVVSTGARTEFGKIAAGLSTHQLDTEFQVGLRKFSMLLVYVAGALTTSIFVLNVVLHKPIMDALLFSLAIAVGITPQLLPAVVSSSLAAGSRRMSRRKVLVKRLVCIEDLGNVDVLFTDKTGTLTAGRIEYTRAVAANGSRPAATPPRCCGGDWWRPRTRQPTARRWAGTRWTWRCGRHPTSPPSGGGHGVHAAGRAALRPRTQHGLGSGQRRPTTADSGHKRRTGDRVGPMPGRAASRPGRLGDRVRRRQPRCRRRHPRRHYRTARPRRATRHDLSLIGFLVFLDPPKPDAAHALQRLAGLGSQSRSSPGTTRPSRSRSVTTSV